MRIITAAAVAVFIFLAPILLSRGFVGNSGDMHLHYYPLKHYAATRIIGGELPLWNPYVFGGAPSLANPQTGVFYPGSLLFYLLPGRPAFKIWIYIHMVLLFAGSFALFKKFFTEDSAAFFAAAAITFSSFVVYMIPAGHAVRLAGFAWFPAASLLAWPSDERGHSPRVFLPAALAAAAMSFQFFSGHPQGVFISCAFLFFVCAASFRRRIKYFAALAALFWALSAAQYFPSAELAALSENIFWKPLAKAYSLGLSDLLSIVKPSAWGNPVSEKLAIPVSYFFERKNLFVGYAAPALALAGIFLAFAGVLRRADLRRAPVHAVFAAAGLAGFCLSLGFNLPGYEFLYDNAPFLSSFRTPSRFYFMTIASCAYFAALALSALPKSVRTAAVLLTFAELFAWNSRFIYTMDIGYSKSRFERISETPDRIYTDPGIPAGVSMMTRVKNANGYDALILKDYFRTFYSTFASSERRPATFLETAVPSEPVTRDFPGWGVRYVLSPEKFDGVSPVSSEAGIYLYEKAVYSPRIFAPSRVETMTRDKYVNFYPSSSDPFEMIFIPELPASKNNLLMTVLRAEESPEKISIDVATEKGGTLVFGETFYPGWRAWCDGVPSAVRRASRVFRTIEVSAGTRRIRMAYLPFSVVSGIIMTLAASFAVVGVLYKKAAGYAARAVSR